VPKVEGCCWESEEGSSEEQLRRLNRPESWEAQLAKRDNSLHYVRC
jgi:hypothetical protein